MVKDLIVGYLFYFNFFTNMESSSILKKKPNLTIDWEKKMPLEMWDYTCEHHAKIADLSALSRCTKYLNQCCTEVFSRKVGTHSLEVIFEYLTTYFFSRDDDTHTYEYLDLLEVEELLKYCIWNAKINADMIKEFVGTRAKEFRVFVGTRAQEFRGAICLHIFCEVMGGRWEGHPGRIAQDSAVRLKEVLAEVGLREIKKLPCYADIVRTIIALRGYNNEGLGYLKLLENAAIAGEEVVKSVIENVLERRNDLSETQQLKLVVLLQHYANAQLETAWDGATKIANLIVNVFGEYEALTEDARERLIKYVETFKDHENPCLVCMAVYSRLKLTKYSDEGLSWLKYFMAAKDGIVIFADAVIENVLKCRKDLDEMQQLELVELLKQYASEIPCKAIDLIRYPFGKYEHLEKSARKGLLVLAMTFTNNEDSEVVFRAVRAVLELTKYSNEGLAYLKFLKSTEKEKIDEVCCVISDILECRKDLSETQQLELIELLEHHANKSCCQHEKMMDLIGCSFGKYKDLSDSAMKRLQALVIASTDNKDALAVCMAVDTGLKLTKYSDEGLGYYLKLLESVVKEGIAEREDERGDEVHCRISDVIDNVLESRKDLSEIQQLGIIELIKRYANTHPGQAMGLIGCFGQYSVLADPVRQLLQALVKAFTSNKDPDIVCSAALAGLELTKYSEESGYLKLLKAAAKEGGGDVDFIIRKVLKSKTDLSEMQQLELVELLEHYVSEQRWAAMDLIVFPFGEYSALSSSAKKRLQALVMSFTNNEDPDVVCRAAHAGLKLTNYSDKRSEYLKLLANVAKKGVMHVESVIKDILQWRKNLNETQQLELIELLEHYVSERPRSAMDLIGSSFGEYTALEESARKRLQTLIKAFTSNKEPYIVCWAALAGLELTKDIDEESDYLQLLKGTAKEASSEVNFIIRKVLESKKNLSEIQQLELVELLEHYASERPRSAMDLIGSSFGEYIALADAARKRLQALIITFLNNQQPDLAARARAAYDSVKM